MKNYYQPVFRVLYQFGGGPVRERIIDIADDCCEAVKYACVSGHMYTLCGVEEIEPLQQALEVEDIAREI